MFPQFYQNHLEKQLQPANTWLSKFWYILDMGIFKADFEQEFSSIFEAVDAIFDYYFDKE